IRRAHEVRGQRLGRIGGRDVEHGQRRAGTAGSALLEDRWVVMEQGGGVDGLGHLTTSPSTCASLSMSAFLCVSATLTSNVSLYPASQRPQPAPASTPRSRARSTTRAASPPGTRTANSANVGAE